MKDKKRISPAVEDYLETILNLHNNHGRVRSIDVALELGVSKAGVHKATHNLKEQGLITQEHYGEIVLTDAGQKAAEAVLERHTVIKRFLVEFLGVNKVAAEADACKIEHNISTETLETMKGKLKKL